MSHVYTGRSRPAPGADTFPRWVLFLSGAPMASMRDAEQASPNLQVSPT